MYIIKLYCRVDNSLETYKQKVEEMKELMEKFSNAINILAIQQPLNELQEAVRCGFPDDIADTYYHCYMGKKIAKAEEIIKHIDTDVIPYLENVSSFLGKALNRGNAIGIASGAANILSTGNSIVKTAIAKNNADLEKALGIKKGPPMSIEEADKQNANPRYEEKYILDENGNYYEHDNSIIRRPFFYPKGWENTKQRYSKNRKYNVAYHINCATCAIAYVLRLRGFNVFAKGNTRKNSLNHKLANGEFDYFRDVWRNADGTQVTPTMLVSWADGKNITNMTKEDFERYFADACKEDGVYIVTVQWKREDYGHAAILQRENGILYYIEPQVYDARYALPDGRRPISDLTSRDMKIANVAGILRVDDKILDERFADLFNT